MDALTRRPRAARPVRRRRGELAAIERWENEGGVCTRTARAAAPSDDRWEGEGGSLITSRD